MDWGEIKNHLRQGKGGNADPGLERPPHPAGGHPCQRRCASHRRQGLSGVRRNTPGNHDTRRVLIVLSLVAFRPFRPPKFPRSTKPAPPSLQLAAGTGQHRLFPAPGCVLPHPLQNRVPRVQVLLPLPKKRDKRLLVSLFFVSAHKDSATRHGCALRSACRGVSERQWRSAANRPRRQPRQVRPTNSS